MAEADFVERNDLGRNAVVRAADDAKGQSVDHVVGVQAAQQGGSVDLLETAGAVLAQWRGVRRAFHASELCRDYDRGGGQYRRHQ